jgi:nitroreductase/NAD-dependent dihydropyrimidine dehydrogenase PreA subunit
MTVDEERCARDGICVAECPLGIIELGEGSSTPSLVKNADGKCLACGHCVAVCPRGALSLDVMEAEACPPVQPDMALTPGHAEHFLRSRRSIRSFRKDRVERDILNQLIDVAHYGPTGGNSQQVRWLVIDSLEGVHELAGHTVGLLRHMIQSNHPMTETYSLSDLVAAWEAGDDRVLRQAPVLVVAYAPSEYPMAPADCAIALSYLDLAAPSFGLGACWAGFFMLAVANWPPLQQALALPEGHSCFGAMMVGYPKHRYHRLPLRNEAQISWRA